MIFNGNNDCLVHLIANDLTGTCFSQITFHVRLLLFWILLCNLGFLCHHCLDSCDVLSNFADPSSIVKAGLLRSGILN